MLSVCCGALATPAALSFSFTNDSKKEDRILTSSSSGNDAIAEESSLREADADND